MHDEFQKAMSLLLAIGLVMVVLGLVSLWFRRFYGRR